MNITQTHIIYAAIRNAQDSLYRAELELRRANNPQIASSKTEFYIAELKQHIAALQEGLPHETP